MWGHHRGIDPGRCLFLRPRSPADPYRLIGEAGEIRLASVLDAAGPLGLREFPVRVDLIDESLVERGPGLGCRLARIFASPADVSG